MKVAFSDVEVWFQDEARVGQQGTNSRKWHDKKIRARAIKQTEYEWAYIFGAVCPERDKAVCLIFPRVDTYSMNEHLREISRNVAHGKIAVIICDRASWHTSSGLEIPDNIVLMPLPAYSPELNSIEQFWQRLRRLYFSNRRFKDYDDIVNACADAINEFIVIPNAIKKLCSRSWASINV